MLAAAAFLLADLLHPVVATRHAASAYPRTEQDGARDVYEGRLWAIAAAGRRESDSLTWEIGARFDLTAFASADPTARTRYGFEARAWETWVDVAPVDTLRLKIGEQMLSWGKLDLACAACVLSAIDLRQGPSADPTDLRLPVPIASATWLASEAVQLDVAAAPIFVPDRFDVQGSNYALLGPSAPSGVAPVLKTLRDQLSPAAFDAVAADLAKGDTSADPRGGEAAARLTLRAGGVDVGLTAGTVRSKLPAVRITPRASPAVSAAYPRYLQTAVDAETAVGPITIAAEIGYASGTTQYVRRPDAEVPVVVGTDLAQAGVKATWIDGESFQATAEATIRVPTEKPRGTWVGYGDATWLAAGMVGLSKTFDAHRLSAIAVATSSGPSLAAIVRYGYAPAESWVVGVGAAAFFGSTRDPDSIAALSNRMDQGFVYAEWRP